MCRGDTTRHVDGKYVGQVGRAADLQHFLVLIYTDEFTDENHDNRVFYFLFYAYSVST